MPITLAIPGRPPVEVDAETITIGSDPAGTIAMPGDERIKPRHAVIRRVAGRWLVEAREAESIQVGNAPPARVHWLSPGDVIRLAAGGPEITFQPQPASPRLAATPVRPPVEKNPASAAEPPAPAVRASPPLAAPQAAPAPPPPAAGPDPFAMEPVELASLKAAVASDDRLRVKPLPAPGERKPAESPPQRRKFFPALGIAAGLTLVTVVAAAVWMIGFGRIGEDDRQSGLTRPGTGDDVPPQVTKKKKKKTAESETATAAATPADEKTHPAEPRPQPPPRKAPPVSAEPAALSDPQRFLYAVLVQNADRQQQFRLGTAWAVSPRRLVTSGAVVMAIEELQKSGLTARVSPAVGTAPIRITGTRAHPAYRQAFQDAAAARQQLEADKDVGSSSKKRKPAGSSTESDVESTRARLDRAYAAQADCDVGVLNVDQPMVHLLMPAFARPVTADEQLRLVGLPFPVDDYRASEPGPGDRVEQFSFTIAADEEGKVDPLHLRLDFSGEMAGRNWSGSPILNSAGQVVGVYSRPLAGQAGDKSGDEGRLSHAVTPIARLREIAPDLQ